MKLKNNFFLLIGSFFAVVGVGLLVAGIFSYRSSSRFLESASRAEGQVVEIVLVRGENSTVYSPRVVFNTDSGEEIEFVSQVGSNPPEFEVGEKVEVLYDPLNPGEAKVSEFFSIWLFSLILFFIGAGFVLIGSIFVSIEVAEIRKRKYLLLHGQKVMADYEGVVQDFSTASNGRHPYRINAQWKDPVSGNVFLFQSAPIWYNPEQYVTKKQLEVLVDPKNYKRHYMDTSFLPQEA